MNEIFEIINSGINYEIMHGYSYPQVLDNLQLSRLSFLHIITIRGFFFVNNLL